MPDPRLSLGNEMTQPPATPSLVGVGKNSPQCHPPSRLTLLGPPCSPLRPLRRMQIYMTSQSLQSPFSLENKTFRGRPPLSHCPLLTKTSFKNHGRKLFIPGLWCWEHRQMAPELAARQTQKVPNTIGLKQPRTFPSPEKYGE